MSHSTMTNMTDPPDIDHAGIPSPNFRTEIMSIIFDLALENARNCLPVSTDRPTRKIIYVFLQ